MAPVTNGRVLFNSIPTESPESGKVTVYDTSETIDVDKVSLNGGFLIKTLELSVEPFLRIMMQVPNPKSSSALLDSHEFLEKRFHIYILPNECIRIFGYGVGVVLRSEFSSVKAGDHIYGFLNHKNYDIKNDLKLISVVENKLKLPWSYYLGAAGMSGKTAYMGWKEYSYAKRGEMAFITSGAGNVGSLVIQLAKKDGLKVIASAGSKEKVQLMKDCGADVVFNYKTKSTQEVLEKEGPIDVYWDNVGGEIPDLALNAANSGARFIECGMLSGYNTGIWHPIKNVLQIIAKSLTIHGFIITNLQPKYDAEFYQVVPAPHVQLFLCLSNPEILQLSSSM